MIIVNHNVNTVKKLKETPLSCGVEIDVRPFGKKLILHHDPFSNGVDVEEFLKFYNHKLLILNVKSEGIEDKLLNLMSKYRIKDYFLLDVSFPFIIKLVNKGVSKIAVRFSEFESIETCLNLKNKVEWVFIDNLTHLPLDESSYTKLKKHFKICIVSPELLNRDELAKTKRLLNRFPVDAVLTDKISDWKK